MSYIPGHAKHTTVVNAEIIFPAEQYVVIFCPKFLVNLASHLLKSFYEVELFAVGLTRLENTGRLICIPE